MTGLIILAAGQSARLGQPKQNLLYKGRTLLQHTVDIAIATPCNPILVVTGANAGSIENITNHPGIVIVHNPHWKEGMASSVRAGMLAIKNKQEIDSVIIMLCDQPLVTSRLIDQLIKKQASSGKAIIACGYQETVGVPALFKSTLFENLISLKGTEGAKKIITDHAEDLAVIPFEDASIDIDTIEDYQQLIASSQIK